MATVPAATPADTSEGLGAYGPVGRSAWLDVDWSTHQRWVTVAGQPVNVCEIGPADGDPIVWIHGLSGSWQNWLENLPAFAAAGIVGNSMGGFIASELAIRFPERVERLVLVSAAGLSVEDLRNDMGMAMLHRLDFLLGACVGWVASKSDFVAKRERLRFATFSIVAAHPQQLPAPLVEENLRGSGKPGFMPSVEALTTYPIRERLPEIGCPVLIVWGTKDHLVPVKDAHEFERLIPDSRKVIYEDTGHVPQMERPAAFNALVRDFIAEAPDEDVDRPG